MVSRVEEEEEEADQQHSPCYRTIFGYSRQRAGGSLGGSNGGGLDPAAQDMVKMATET